MTFNVVGRYMDGQKVVGYQLAGQDGSQLQVNVERVIFMIGRGEVANMRIQYVNGEVVPRGKGVNLQKLPVFDVKKQEFRRQGQQQAQGQGQQAQEPKRDYEQIGQQRIIARIMKDGRIEGYVVQDFSGQIKKLPKQEVIRLASNKIISNAQVVKTNPYSGMSLEQAQQLKNFNKGEWDYVQRWGYITRLQGVGVQLDKLPVWIILKNGSIINVQDSSNALKASFRAFKMNRGGIVYNTVDNTHKQFKAGDILQFLANGKLEVIPQGKFNTSFARQRQRYSDCDACISDINNFEIEIFGSQKQKISVQQLQTWPIFQMQQAE